MCAGEEKGTQGKKGKVCKNGDKDNTKKDTREARHRTILDKGETRSQEVCGGRDRCVAEAETEKAPKHTSRRKIQKTRREKGEIRNQKNAKLLTRCVRRRRKVRTGKETQQTQRKTLDGVR